jgi:hypothetical protein
MAITVTHSKVSAIPDGADTSVVRPSDWNADHVLTGTIPVANGGTGAATADGAVTNLLPSQTGNTGKYLTTDGTNTSWSANASGDVVGPASATDNAITRFDGTTGKLIQNSVVTVGDTGIVAGASISGSTNTLSNIGNAALTNSAITINGTSTSLGGSISVGTVTSIIAGTGLSGGTITSTGTIAIDSTVATLTGTQTLTNKRINPRPVDAGSTSGTLTPNGDTTDVFNAFGLTGAITMAAPSGTPVDGQKLMLRFEDNGTGRGITWTTSSGAYRAVGVTLPTTTVASKVTYVGCVYNSTDVFWDVIAVATQA